MNDLLGLARGHTKTRVQARAVWAFFLAVLLGGCLSRAPLHRQSFTFSTPVLEKKNVRPDNGRVLAIRRLSVAAPFAGQSFVYRTGAVSYEQDPYAQFLVPPEDSLAGPVRAYLGNAGKVQAVVESGSGLKPNLQMEISVPELYGDFRDRAAPAAVLEMSFRLFDAPEGLPTKVLSEKTYTQSIRLEAPTAAALMKGWDEALKRILSQAAEMLSSSPIAGQASRSE